MLLPNVLPNLSLFVLLPLHLQANTAQPRGTPTASVSQSELPSRYVGAARNPFPNVEAITSIQQTLNMYPFIIDGKQWDMLSIVFYEDVWANYSALIGAFHPLSVLKEGLENAVSAATTMHLLGTQLIDVHESGEEATSATYFYASHFGTGERFGQVRMHLPFHLICDSKEMTVADFFIPSMKALWAWGIYEDRWLREESSGQWKIIQRTVEYPVSHASKSLRIMFVLTLLCLVG